MTVDEDEDEACDVPATANGEMKRESLFKWINNC
jgi:hypothetical protein